jgi:hypothetical protein
MLSLGFGFYSPIVTDARYHEQYSLLGNGYRTDDCDGTVRLARACKASADSGCSVVSGICQGGNPPEVQMFSLLL